MSGDLEARGKHREMRGQRLDLHCPYDEATLRQDMDYADRAICPCCWTSFPKQPARALSPSSSVGEGS